MNNPHHNARGIAGLNPLHHADLHQSREDMRHILSKSDLNMLGDYSDASEYNHKSPRVYRVNHFVLPVFFLEVIAVGCVGALAYYLRFTDVFPLREFPVNCSDPDIHYAYINATSLLTDIPLEIVCSVALLFPLVTMFLGELGFWLFSSKPKKVVRAQCIGLKLHLMPRRFFRYGGLFLLGLFATSIFTDISKQLIARPRPYYLAVCDVICHQADGSIRVNDQEQCLDIDHRTARSSFPSFYASLSIYSAVYISVYLHTLLTARGARLLRPIICLALTSLALFIGLSRYLLHRSHWEDVLVGQVLGIVIAIYMAVFAGNSFQENERTDLLTSRRKSGNSSPTLPLNDAKSPFFSWFQIPRAGYKSKPARYINGFLGNTHADFQQDSAPVVYHPDLNRSIDNYSRTSNPHVQHY